MVNNISGVILAGGVSKRFNGIIKAKIIIDGSPIISRIIEIFSDIFDEIIIVTNTPDEYKDYNSCRIIGDQFLNKGPLGGIHSAMKATDKEALFVVAGDMPLLDKEIILRQLDYYNMHNNECDVLIPSIKKYIEPLHGIYKKMLISFLEEYLSGNNDYAIREFIKETAVLYMKIDGSLKSGSAFTNINSPADVAVVKKLMGLDD